MMLGERRNNNFIQSLELCRPTCHTSSQADLEFDWFYLDLVQHNLQKGSWNHTAQIPHATQRQKGSAESTIPRRSHGRHADVLHFHQRACPFHICCSRRWGEMSKWWSVKQADSWNNPRLRKEKKTSSENKVGFKCSLPEDGTENGTLQDESSGCFTTVSSPCWNERGGITNQTKSPYMMRWQWLFCVVPCLRCRDAHI